jgi:hypothetical protein
MPRRLTFEEAARIGESLPPIGLIGKAPLTRSEWEQLSRWRRLVAWFQLRHPLSCDQSVDD